MNYTIETATTKDRKRLVELCKHGAFYLVSIWNKETKSTEKRLEFDRLETAKNAFFALCDEIGAYFAHTETEIDFDYSNID